MDDFGPTGYVVLTEELNLQRAHWIAGGIEAAGIPVHVEENNLQDEFAVAQKAMGGIRIRVLVPEEHYDEANTVFLALSQPIPDDPAFHDEEDDAALEEMEDQRFAFTAGASGLLILALFVIPLLIIIVMNLLG